MERKERIWTSDMRVELQEKWYAGMSPDAMAMHFSMLMDREITEHAVFAMARRLGLPRRVKVSGGQHVVQATSRGTSHDLEDVIAQVPDHPKRKLRTCLCCREDFISDGPGNRICNSCKESTAWSSGGDYSVL